MRMDAVLTPRGFTRLDPAGSPRVHVDDPSATPLPVNLMNRMSRIAVVGGNARCARRAHARHCVGSRIRICLCETGIRLG